MEIRAERTGRTCATSPSPSNLRTSDVREYLFADFPFKAAPPTRLRHNSRKQQFVRGGNATWEKCLRRLPSGFGSYDDAVDSDDTDTTTKLSSRRNWHEITGSSDQRQATVERRMRSQPEKIEDFRSDSCRVSSPTLKREGVDSTFSSEFAGMWRSFEPANSFPERRQRTERKVIRRFPFGVRTTQSTSTGLGTTTKVPCDRNSWDGPT